MKTETNEITSLNSLANKTESYVLDVRMYVPGESSYVVSIWRTHGNRYYKQ
jgi:hypothetical protein